MDVFDQMNDPGCELDRLRDEVAKLKAALVATEAERDDARAERNVYRENLDVLACLAHTVSESLATAAQSLSPGTRPQGVPPQLLADLADLRDGGGQVIPLNTKAAEAPTSTAHHNPSTHNPKGAS